MPNTLHQMGLLCDTKKQNADVQTIAGKILARVLTSMAQTDTDNLPYRSLDRHYKLSNPCRLCLASPCIPERSCLCCIDPAWPHR